MGGFFDCSMLVASDGLGGSLDNPIIMIGEDRQLQVEEQEDEAYDNDNEDRRQPEQEVKEDVVATLMTGKVGDTHLFSEDKSPGLANRGPSPGPSQDRAGSDSHSDDELNTNSYDKEGEPHPIKRKRPSPFRNGPIHKKRKQLQERSTRQHRLPSKPHGRSPKLRFPFDQGSTAAAVSSTKGGLPSPAPSLSQATDTDMSPDYCNLDRSGAVLPTLTEVTFCPHSQHCYSFTAVIREGCDGRGVSFSQVAQLIASIGHIGKINDFLIKPVVQHSLLLTGFSRHTSSRLSSSGTILSTAVEADPILDDAPSTISQHGRTVNTRTVSQQGISKQR
ncbi:hypothetical protein BGZ57DRAFT_237292 [Hyaloscypha finlandica]|nr:hypothetical protein BGZ57DRAFT_237292 [Hyaloscypha finlandica]